MSERTLTVTLQPDWRAALREAGRRARKRGYQGEVLNFESAGAFFDQLSERGRLKRQVGHFVAVRRAERCP